MKIVVRFLGMLPSVTLRQHSERQALLHLGRFGRDLSSVAIRIRDVNGPKGGVDKECRVFAKGARLGFSTLVELSEDAYQAVDAAIARLTRTIARGQERARDWKVGVSHSSLWGTLPPGSSSGQTRWPNQRTASCSP